MQVSIIAHPQQEACPRRVANALGEAVVAHEMADRRSLSARTS
jgi:hypothetical protein